MIRCVSYKGAPPSLRIAAIEQVEGEILNCLEESICKFCEVRWDWISRKSWKACYSRDGDFDRYEMVSLIRYCKKMKIEKLLAISVFFIMDKTKAAKARVFDANWIGLCQALWGVDAERHNPEFDDLNLASLEPFLIVPYKEGVCEFILVRELGEGVVLAGPGEFLEYMVSRSRGEWYVGSSLEFRREEKIFKAQKDRKAAIREDKMERD